MAIQRQAASIQEKQPLGGAHRSKKNTNKNILIFILVLI